MANILAHSLSICRQKTSQKFLSVNAKVLEYIFVTRNQIISNREKYAMLFLSWPAFPPVGNLHIEISIVILNISNPYLRSVFDVVFFNKSITFAYQRVDSRHVKGNGRAILFFTINPSYLIVSYFLVQHTSIAIRRNKLSVSEPLTVM